MSTKPMSDFKPLSLFSLIIVILIDAFGFGQNWEQITNFPGAPLDDGVGFQLNNKFYFGTGLNAWFEEEERFFCFDPQGEIWTAGPSLPEGEGRVYASAFASDSMAYVFGGFRNGNFLKDLWKFDPQENTWTLLNNFPSFARSGCSVFEFEDEAFIVGGKSDSQDALNEVWRFDFVTETWEQKNDCPVTLWKAAYSQQANKGYLALGKKADLSYSSALLEYNPATDTWTQISSFPVAGRTHASLFFLNDKLHLTFGLDSLNQSYNDLWIYNMASGNWINSPGIPALGRRGGIGLVHNEILYYSTGINGNNQRLTETWKYSPSLFLQENNFNQNRSLVKTTDLMGRDVPQTYTGIVLRIYSDGSFVKEYQTAQ